MQAIFIVGEQRSGSNLLRLMLSQAGIAAPHPPHLLSRMLPLVPSYGDLSNDDCWRQLVNDACELVERNPVPWIGTARFDRLDIAARCRERSLYAIFGALMDTFAEASGAKAWVCKSMQYSRYGAALDAYFQSPRYIYLYRDGRDVTLSFTKAVVGEKHPYFISKRWAELQRICLAERERVGPERYFSLCYEELTGEPEVVLRRLCAFLDVAFNPSMMAFHRSSEAENTSDKSQLWQNLSRPIMRNNTRKFLKGLTTEEIGIVESLAGDVLDVLGYERVQVRSGQEQVFSPEDIAHFTALNTRRKKERRSMMEEGDAERRAHQLKLLIERVYFLADLSHADAIRFLQFAEEQHLREGETIIEAGDSDRTVYFLICGELVVLSGETEIARIGPGEPFGELATLTGRPRTRTVQAATSCRLMGIRWEQWKMMRSEAPDIAAAVLWAISTRLAERFSRSNERSS